MNLNSDAWCNLVFQGKNKDYGAYYLRKTSSRRHLYALAIMAGIVGVGLLLFFLINQTPRTGDFKWTPVNLSDVSIIESVHFEALPQPAMKEPPKKESIAQNPPEITDEEDTEPIEELDDVNIPGDSIGEKSLDSALTANQIQQEDSVHGGMVKDQMTYILGEKNTSQTEIQPLQTAIFRYVYQNLKYPPVAYKQRIHGRVEYSFIVNTDGSISDITLVKGIYIFLDEEVLRVLQSMPPLDPVIKDGKPIRAKCYLPVTFSL